MQLLELQGVTRYWPVLDPDLYFLLGIYSCMCWTLNCMFRAMDLCWTLTCIFPGLWPCVGPPPPGLLSCHCFSRILRFNHPILCFILHCLTLLLILFHWLKSKTLTASSDLADLNTLRWFLHYFFSLHCNYLWANPSGAPQKKLKALDVFFGSCYKVGYLCGLCKASSYHQVTPCKNYW